MNGKRRSMNFAESLTESLSARGTQNLLLDRQLEAEHPLRTLLKGTN
jgi:hypothetical protein